MSFVVKILNQGYIDSEIKEYFGTLEKKDYFQIIYQSHNLGPSRGRNILFDNIETPYVLSLDDDIYLPPNWFANIRRFFNEFPEISVIGLSLIAPGGKKLATAHQIEYQGPNVAKIVDVIRPSPEAKIKDGFYITDYVSEGAMVLRSSILDTFSWDKNLLVCFEGFDLGLQFMKAGIKSVIYTELFSVHDSISKDIDSKGYIKERRNYHKIRKDYIYIWKKWKVRFPFVKHFFYTVVCAIFPNSLLRWVALIWLNTIKPLLGANRN